MYKIGLKLWSINTDYYYDEAIRLYNNGVYDYIELYVVPNTTDTIEKWKKLDIPFTLHAPHFLHDVNLADESKFDYNMQIYKQVSNFADELNAKYVVVHGGIQGSLDELIRQFNIVKRNCSSELIIENKPYKAPIGENRFCRGASVEEIKTIMDGTDCRFCLDIGHAVCSANSFNKEPYDYIEQYNSLNPLCYHFSDNTIDNTVDKHEHFGNGNFDFKRILGIINKNTNVAIETKKLSKTNLDDFILDCDYLKKISKYGEK